MFGNPGAGNSRPQFGNGGMAVASISDGTSNTVLFAEKLAQCALNGGGTSNNRHNLWAHGAWNNSWAPVFAVGPADASSQWADIGDGQSGSVGAAAMFQVQPRPVADCGKASGPHSGVLVVGLGDGSVRNVRSTVDPLAVWGPLLTPAQGDLVGDF